MKMLPIILALVGTGGGMAAGHFLAPQEEKKEAAEHGDEEHQDGQKVAMHDKAEAEEKLSEPADYVRLSNQFVVPIVEKERVASLIVLSLALETAEGTTDAVYQREPKLRDEFLTVLFAHARSGGFTGAFTVEHVMQDLRQSLLAAARGVLGKQVKNVLVIDIVRQDL